MDLKSVEGWVKVINEHPWHAHLIAEAVALNNFNDETNIIGHGKYPDFKEAQPQTAGEMAQNIVRVTYLLLVGEEDYTYWDQYQDAITILYQDNIGNYMHQN